MILPQFSTFHFSISISNRPFSFNQDRSRNHIVNGLFTRPRALSVSGPALSDISKPLTPLRLVGTDGINQLFDYRLTLQTSDRAGTGVGVGANLDLDSVIGKEITCTIELEGMGSFIPGLPGGSAGHIGAGTREISAL